MRIGADRRFVLPEGARDALGLRPGVWVSFHVSPKSHRTLLVMPGQRTGHFQSRVDSRFRVQVPSGLFAQLGWSERVDLQFHPSSHGIIVTQRPSGRQ